jgi:hypothetical protein
MSNGTTTPQKVPLSLSVAPFPEGFSGDMDETWQQGTALIEAYMEGNFLTGLVLPPGSTLPNTDQGPIFMGGIWYFWNPATGSYQPQSAAIKAATNYVKNPIYQVQQNGAVFNNLPVGETQLFDMSVARMSEANVVSVSVMSGPLAGPLNDAIGSAILYTVGTTLVPTPVATDLCAHEHLIEGVDIAMLQGQQTSLSFWVWATAPGTYSVYITNSGRDHSYVITFSIATASTWTHITVPSIPAFPTAGTWAYGEGATGVYIGFPMLVGTQWQTSNLGSWQPAFYAGSAANINMLTVTNNQLAITGIKFEASPSPTYLTVPAFEDDLNQLMRYFFTSFLYQSKTAGTPIQFAANQVGSWAAAYIFPRRMCKAPAVTPYSWQTHAAGLITDISTNPQFDIPVSSLPAARNGIAGTGVSSVSTTGNLNATTTISGIPSTAGISTGAQVTGTGIPPGTTVVTIISATSLALSQAATATATGVALKFVNFSNFTTTGTTNSYSTTGTTDGSTTSITASPSTSSILIGMPVTGPGIPAGSVVTSIVSGTAITISLPTTAAGTGVALVFGTQSITAIPSTAQMAVGMPISGTGIPAGSTIASIASGTAITISNFLTAFGTGVALTVGLFNKGDVFWTLITADARLS